MEELYRFYYRLVAETSFKYKRYLYDKIDWNDRLIIIKGPKGVGKTTLLLQHIKDTFADDYSKAIFASLDHVWFGNHSILELAEYHYSHGGTHLFLDEVHKYENWQQEIKNIYDYFPNLYIIVTGSSLLQIDASSKGDLSRRYVAYDLHGLSLREFILIETGINLGVYSLEDIVKRHIGIATEISSKLKILPFFENYVKHGYYPYYQQSLNSYYDKVQNSVINVIESDIPLVGRIDYESVYKIKQLLSIMSQECPFTINANNLAATLEISRNTLIKLIDLLDRAKIMRKLLSSTKGIKALQKPEKLLFNDTNIMYALGLGVADKGTMRETFAASQLSVAHGLLIPGNGDLLVDERILFEIGGRRKSFAQIKGLDNSYVLSDEIEIGVGNKIPLWIIGLMY